MYRTLHNLKKVKFYSHHSPYGSEFEQVVYVLCA